MHTCSGGALGLPATVRLKPRHYTVLGAIFLLWSSTSTAAAPFSYRFTATSRAEVIATVTARCDRCAWDVDGREAVVLRLTLDGRYLQHLPLVRSGRAEYQVMVGDVAAGQHVLEIEEDATLTARDLRGSAANVETITIKQILTSATEYRAVSLAPILYARADTIGRFTDVPLFMWYETEPTARGSRYRYSIIFSNEDGGTPTDRLMATWGRTTDIEYVCSVEVSDDGRVLEADMQGPEHEVLPFRGTREGSHALLWVSTSNNMVLDSGTTSVRYAPAPIFFPLRDVSREAVMDAHPWTYEVAARELMRERKIVADAPTGNDQIPDPRRFVYLEACGELNGTALAFAIHVRNQWIPSDRGVPQYRIARDGCFRAAIPLPSSLALRDVTRLRAQAHTRVTSGAPGPAPKGSTRLRRINRMFMLDDAYKPQASVMTWTGERTLVPDGPPVEIATPRE